MREFQNGLIFLNLAKQFRRYLNFSAEKNGFFYAKLKENLHIWTGTKKKIFDEFFNFLGINTHNFVKIDPKFENKDLFHAKFYEV